MNKKYRQLKLTGGDEIICEVIDETDYEIVIRYAALIVAAEDFTQRVRYYTFRPYMMYQELPDQHILLNPDHIACISVPHEYIISQWQNHIKQSARKIPSMKDLMEESPNPAYKEDDITEEDRKEIRDMIDQFMNSMEWMPDSDSNDLLH